MMRLLKGIWRVLSGISRVITVLAPLVFVAIFVIAFSAGLSDSTPEPLPEKAALLIAPSGPLVEDAPPAGQQRIVVRVRHSSIRPRRVEGRLERRRQPVHLRHLLGTERLAAVAVGGEEVEQCGFVGGGGAARRKAAWKSAP